VSERGTEAGQSAAPRQQQQQQQQQDDDADNEASVDDAVQTDDVCGQYRSLLAASSALWVFSQFLQISTPHTLPVAVLGFSFGGGALGWRYFHLGGTQLILSR